MGSGVCPCFILSRVISLHPPNTGPKDRPIMKKSSDAHIEPYTHPAAGWGALKAVTVNLIKERVPGGKYKMLFRQNQPDGFD